MTYSIPLSSQPGQIRKGDQSLRVWTLQKALNSTGFKLALDGDFGDQTDSAVKLWQSMNRLLEDGVFGPSSSVVLANQLCGGPTGVPLGLVRGQVEAESGNWIVAVNWTVSGGVDCGYTQRRVYTPDLSKQDVILRAFDSEYQIGLLATRLRERSQLYSARPAVNSDEFAWRLSSLYHNWEYGADKLSETKISDLSPYWTAAKPAEEWPTNVGARFPGGEPVDTPLKWAKFYSLGAPSRKWPGATTKYVTDWTV